MTACQETFIALGSNMPFEGSAPLEILRRAAGCMPEYGLRVTAASPIYQTPPFPASDQPDYVNAVVAVATDLPADDVLQACLDIEHQFARTRPVRWGARTLDLDLLAHGTLITPDVKRWHELATMTDADVSRLVVPHPRMHKRSFVLAPLADIAPDWRHPVFGSTVDNMITLLEPVTIKKLSEKLL